MIFDPSIGDWFAWDDEDHGWDTAEWCPAFLADPDNLPLLWKYLSLITSEHNQQPRFMRTVALWVSPIIEGLRLVKRLETLFDIDTATGNALDATGRWVGLTRRLTVENTNYFSWDIAPPPPPPSARTFTLDGTAEEGLDYGVWAEPQMLAAQTGIGADLGWDQGEWLGPYSDDRTVVVLDDEQYRLVLKARIAANMWDGTRQGAYDAWQQYFGPLGYQVAIDDNFDRVIGWLTWDEEHPFGYWDNSFWDQAELTDRGRCTGTMWMTMLLLGPPPDPVLSALFTGGYFDLRPAGVGIGYLTTQYSEDCPDGFPLFAWDEGAEGEPEGVWFSWDEPELGWDTDGAEWWPMGPANVFTLDGAAEQGLDYGVWAEPGALVALADTGAPQPLWFAGWDIGAWPREIEPLPVVGPQPLLEAA